MPVDPEDIIPHLTTPQVLFILFVACWLFFLLGRAYEQQMIIESVIG